MQVRVGRLLALCLLFVFVEGFFPHLAMRIASLKGGVRATTEAVDVVLIPGKEVVKKGDLGAWLPIGSASALVGDTPTAITVAGIPLVVWKSPISAKWSVMRDQCPHRLAPLSQGRVDTQTGCLECPYHGWQFEASGACSKIPQLEREKHHLPSSTSAASLPVHQTGDVLFAFVPLPEGQASSFTTLPEEIFPSLLNVTSVTTRLLPYSFDFVVENFVDPAHIPFAHHSLQGVREDGSPIPMEIVANDAEKIEVAYKDIIRGKSREGVVSFIAPCYYHFRLKDKGIVLLILVAPVSPGLSRAHLILNTPRALPKWIPTWLVHGFTNNFLDTDIWVHDQERAARGADSNLFSSPEERAKLAPQYVMPSSSDLGVRAWRTWWAKHLSLSPVFGPARDLVPISVEKQVDRWEQHTKDCVSCRVARENAHKAKQIFAPLVALLFLAVGKNVLVRLLGVASFFAIHKVADMVLRLVEGPSKGEGTSASRIPSNPKKKKATIILQ